jgi:HEAT repeat protein
MAVRRALIVTPLYNGEIFSLLAGSSLLVHRLSDCLDRYGDYDIQVLDNFVTQDVFRQTLYQFFDVDGELLFYFYGHGCLRPPGLGVFATSDAQFYNEGILMDEVIALAQASKAREVVLILDCCHAGAASPVTSSTLEALINRLAPYAGRDVLAACASHQSGWEAKNTIGQQLGAFSSHILDGLEGAARGVGPGSSKVRGSTLGNYVTEIFQTWNQDPVMIIRETGTHHCVITSGFTEKSLAVNPKKIDKQTIMLGVPFKPSQLFVGRAAEIDSLRTMLVNRRKPVAISATVEGFGGIGKTELVLQLLYHPDIQSMYSTIIWLDGAGPILPQWERVAAQLSIRPPRQIMTDYERDLLIQQIEGELNKRGNTLIVLDNASDWASVRNLIPTQLPLLITTRGYGFGGHNFYHLELEVLSEDSAASFLVQMVPELEHDPGFPRLVKALEGHALALEIAGWNIKFQGISAIEYFERLTQHQVDNPQAVATTRYGVAMDGCLSLTWDCLRLDASRNLWRRASLFAPTSAHRDLLKVSFVGDQKTRLELERLKWMQRDVHLYQTEMYYNDEQFSEAYSELRALHVLSRVEGYNGERWAMHRLVRDYGRARLKSGEVMVHALALAEWLRRPTLPLAPEIPHLVATILDAARHANEFHVLDEPRRFEREITTIALTSTRFAGYDERTPAFNAHEFISFIQQELQDPKALTIIMEGLTDINDDVRLRTVELLERVGPIPEVLDGLANSLVDPDVRVRERAMRTLVSYGGEGVITLLSMTVKGLNPRARLVATRILGGMGVKAHSALKEALNSNDIHVQREAALLLCEQGDQAGIQILLNQAKLISMQEPARFFEALGSSKDQRAVTILQDFLSLDDYRIRAIHALGKIKDEKSFQLLLNLLQHNDDAVKCAAAESIDALGVPNGPAMIIAQLTVMSSQQQLSGNFIFIALRIAAKYQLAVPPEVLINLLQHKNVDWQRQRDAVKALGNQKDKEAVPALIEALKNSHPEVRKEAAWALSQIGDASAKKPLSALAQNDKNSDVRSAANQAVRNIKNSK